MKRGAAIFVTLAVLYGIPVSAQQQSGGGGSTQSTTINGVVCTPGSSCTVSTSGSTVVVYTSNVATLTLNSTDLETTIVRQSAPAALLINLPATPILNLSKCVKDGGNGFSTNNATVKTTDGLQIDGVAGTTGKIMNGDREVLCFTFDGTMWNITP